MNLATEPLRLKRACSPNHNCNLGVYRRIKLSGFLLCLRQHLPERLQALVHFAQSHNRASVVAFGFSSGKRFPSFPLHAPHVVKQAVAKTLFPVLARLHDGLSNVTLVASNPAGDIETRFAMFRNGSPVARALSIAPRSA